MFFIVENALLSKAFFFYNECVVFLIYFNNELGYNACG